MPIGPETTFGWTEAAVAFGIVAVVAFLVTWVVTDLLHVARTPYIAILTVVTGALAAGYLAWSGTAVVDLVTAGWGWALVAGVVAWAVVVPAMRRIPARTRPRGAALGRRFAWEGAVYGIAEAVLLATLPVLAVWQAADALGWTDTTWAAIGSGALAIAGALLVIAVHHIGYAEFRSRVARPRLVGALVACGVQALAFLVTGNVLAPIVAHVLLHGQMILRGAELPPVSTDSGRTWIPLEATTSRPVPTRDLGRMTR